FFSSRRRHTRCYRDWSSDVCSSDLFERGCIARLAQLEYRGQVHIVEMARAGVKDVNDLHVKFLNKPGAFASEFGALVELARIAQIGRASCRERVEIEVVGRV